MTTDWFIQNAKGLSMSNAPPQIDLKHEMILSGKRVSRNGTEALIS